LELHWSSESPTIAAGITSHYLIVVSGDYLLVKNFWMDIQSVCIEVINVFYRTVFLRVLAIKSTSEVKVNGE